MTKVGLVWLDSSSFVSSPHPSVPLAGGQRCFGGEVWRFRPPNLISQPGVMVMNVQEEEKEEEEAACVERGGWIGGRGSGSPSIYLRNITSFLSSLPTAPPSSLIEGAAGFLVKNVISCRMSGGERMHGDRSKVTTKAERERGREGL